MDTIAGLGALENTLVYYFIGDNGASAEGGLNGSFSEMLHFNNMEEIETPEYLIKRLDDWGGHDAYNHYAVGWAHAMDTPYQWDQTDRLTLRRHSQRYSCALAQGDSG